MPRRLLNIVKRVEDKSAEGNLCTTVIEGDAVDDRPRNMCFVETRKITGLLNDIHHNGMTSLIIWLNLFYLVWIYVTARLIPTILILLFHSNYDVSYLLTFHVCMTGLCFFKPEISLCCKVLTTLIAFLGLFVDPDNILWCRENLCCWMMYIYSILAILAYLVITIRARTCKKWNLRLWEPNDMNLLYITKFPVANIAFDYFTDATSTDATWVSFCQIFVTLFYTWQGIMFAIYLTNAFWLDGDCSFLLAIASENQG